MRIGGAIQFGVNEASFVKRFLINPRQFLVTSALGYRDPFGFAIGLHIKWRQLRYALGNFEVAT